MKKIAFSLCLLLLFPNMVLAASFSDVSADNSYYPAVESLKNLGIVGGYKDGTFKPNNSVTRAEALKMVLLSAKIALTQSAAETSLSDVPKTAWFYNYIITAITNKIVNGNPDGSFAPNREVNKAEFLKMLIMAFKIDISKHQNAQNLSIDTSAGQWFLPYLSYAKTVGLISPTLDNKLEPDKKMSRGDCAEIIYRLLVIDRGGDPQKFLSIAESNLVEVLIQLNNNNISKALVAVNSAVFYTEQALKAVPKDVIAQGANKIALGFKELCLAYQAGLEGNKDSVVSHVAEAKKYGNAAYALSPSFLSLKNKIVESGDTLLSQTK